MAKDLELKLRITADGKVAVQQLGAVDKAVDGVGDSASEASKGIGGLKNALASLGVAALAREFVQANAAMESNALALQAVLGSQEAAGEAMAYIAATADRLGRSIPALSEQFVSLAAATKGTALEGQATRDIFEAVVGAMSTLGRSSAQTQQALVAVSQMAAKGTVSMEELRGQLGEALPGAIKAMADAMGVSVERLGQMIESGQVLAKDALPALARGLNDAFGLDPSKRVESLTASVERFGNAVSRAFTQTGEAGVADAFQRIIDLGTDGLTGVTAGITTLGRNLGAVGAYVTGAIPSWEELTLAIAENNAAGQDYIDGSKAQAEASIANAGGAAEAGAATVAQTQTIEGLTKTMQAAAKVGQDLVAARAAIATSSAAMAKALGDETAALKQQVIIAGLAAEARSIEAGAKAKVLAAAQDELFAYIASTDAKTAEIEARELSITALKAEVEAANAAVSASAVGIAQAQLAAATYGDQSDQLAGLIQIRDRLTAAIKREGEASAALIPLQQALAVIQVQIADAATDAAAGIERQTQANQRALTIDQARLALQSDESARLAALATARGDAAKAAQYHRDIMRDEASALDMAAKAKARDATLLLERARLMEIAAKATGGYTAEERALVDTMRDSATMAEIESERLRIGALIKIEAASAATYLAEQNRRLAEAFEAAGVAGVQAMDDVRAAVSSAASGPELEALRDGLEAAIQAGIDKAGQLSTALADVQAKIDKLAKTERKAYTSFEQIFAQYGTDIGRYEKGAFQGLQGPGAGEVVDKEIAAYVEWLKANKGYGARATTQPPPTTGSAPPQPAPNIGPIYTSVQIDGYEVARAIQGPLATIGGRRA